MKNERDMSTTSLNIPVEIPNSTTLNLDELKAQLTDYARLLVSRSINGDNSRSRVRSFDELHPQVQELCGIVSLAEDDLDGEMARWDYLKGI